MKEPKLLLKKIATQPSSKCGKCTTTIPNVVMVVEKLKKYLGIKDLSREKVYWLNWLDQISDSRCSKL